MKSGEGDPRTQAERYLDERREDADYELAYGVARRRVDQVDSAARASGKQP